jgi:ABC-type transporter Mla MlaB component
VPDAVAVAADAAAAGPADAVADHDPAEGDGERERLNMSGVLAGSTNSQLAKITEFAQRRAVVAIDLTAVDRIDFVCAGSLLNVINRIESQRKAVQIMGASPIIRALLLLIGISPRHFLKRAT